MTRVYPIDNCVGFVWPCRGTELVIVRMGETAGGIEIGEAMAGNTDTLALVGVILLRENI